MYELDVVEFDASRNEGVSDIYETLNEMNNGEKDTDKQGDIENKTNMESKRDMCKNVLRTSAKKTSLKKVLCYLLVITIVVLLVIALVVVSYVLLSTTKDTATKGCEELTDVANGTIVNITGFNHGDTLGFKCKNGSKLNGPAIITCLSSDKWSASPACVPKQCVNYVAPLHAIVLPKIVSREVGTEIQITCEDGYFLKGDKHVVCQSNEIWSESPLCVPINCGFPDCVTNGQLTGYTDTLYNSTLSVVCNEGYELKGSPRIACEMSGKWSNNTSCELVNCGVPQIPENGSLNQLNGTSFQATASVKCDDGFYVKGDSLITCSANGTWTESPKCDIARDCLDIRQKYNITESGIYDIILWKSGLNIKVYCDQVTDGGGWTVFQYRYDGSVDFYRTFAEYENGFGNLTGEFWLGLRNIEEIASRNLSELRIDLTAAGGIKFYETYKDFTLDKERSYKLYFNESISEQGDIKDLSFNKGLGFTTFDHDVDGYDGNCAVIDKGGWWYNFCTYANLNGQYITPGTIYRGRWECGMIYYTFRRVESLKTSKLMLRRS